MKKSCRLTMSLAFATAFVIAANAQERSTNAAGRPSKGDITVTGCVERADQLGATGTAGTTVDSLSFVLTHASRDGKAAASRPAPSATKETVGETGSTYRLNAAVATLNPHVGHKVQVTGALEAPTTGTSGSLDPASAGNAPRLQVKSVKMLAETCAR
jgi:hypothetical protein